jgi:hypothetical protein
MAHNDSLFRIVLSGAGAVIIGALGAIVGFAWASAVAGPLWPAAALAGIAAAWGATVVHLTPTGGAITEIRTTVNYAVFALHAWYALFLCILAFVILALRSWVL